MKKGMKIVVALGVVAAGGAVLTPLTTHAATNTATITVQVNETLSMTVNGGTSPVTSSVTIANRSVDESTISHEIAVTTNNSHGYTLTVQDSDSDTSLSDGTNSIPAGTTIAAGDTAAWGYKVKEPGESAFESSYHAVPANGSPATLRETSAAVMTAETTTVGFGFATGVVPSGDYTDTIIYTATGNVS